VYFFTYLLTYLHRMLYVCKKSCFAVTDEQRTELTDNWLPNDEYS